MAWTVHTFFNTGIPAFYLHARHDVPERWFKPRERLSEPNMIHFENDKHMNSEDWNFKT